MYLSLLFFRNVLRRVHLHFANKLKHIVSQYKGDIFWIFNDKILANFILAIDFN